MISTLSALAGTHYGGDKELLCRALGRGHENLGRRRRAEIRVFPGTPTIRPRILMTAARNLPLWVMAYASAVITWQISAGERELV